MSRLPDLLLLRHARTAWNADGRLNSHTDIALDEVGQRQAARLAEGLGRLQVGRVVCSPMLRTRQTVAPYAQATGVDVELDDRLVEVGFGAFEGRTDHECRDDPDYRTWQAAEPVPVTVAESLPDALARVRAGFEQLAAEPVDGVLVVVTHGALLRLLLAAQVLGLPLSQYRRLRVDNGTAAAVVRSGSGPALRLVGLGLPPAAVATPWS